MRELREREGGKLVGKLNGVVEDSGEMVMAVEERWDDCRDREKRTS